MVILDPLDKTSVFFRILVVRIKNVLNVGFAIGEIKGLDVRHGGKHSNDSLISIDIGHGMLGVGRM